MSKHSESTVKGLLLLYNHPLAADAATIMENVHAFERHSRFKVWTVNTQLGLPQSLGKLRFQGIVFHYSIFGDRYALNDQFLSYLEENRESYKVAFFQDEYHYCRQRFDFLNHHRIDCVYTLLEPTHFKDVYQKFTNVPKLISHIPGYVSDDLIGIARRKARPDEERAIDIGYRARPLPFYMGQGAQEKTGIATRFCERARALGLRLDIATEEQSRIYGEAWYDFIANCRAFLGVEAGVSIFDVDDVVRHEATRLLAERPGITFQEMSERLLNSRENRIYYRTISPRHFEAAAFSVCQILFEGRYSGIIQPLVHYIPLKKDFSNFDDCIRMFQDKALRRELTDNAYRDLIGSGQYSYQKFIAEFDQTLLEAGLQREVQAEEAAQITARLKRDRLSLQLRARKNALLYHTAFPGRRPLSVLGGPVLRLLRRLRETTSTRNPTLHSKERN
ncbi:MAG: hypothetical protein ABR607_09595 [Pyrinomonadaceae bacterium]